MVDVRVVTTEAAVCERGGLFKHGFPVTTQLARVALGAVGPFVFDGQVQQQQQQQKQDDDSDDDADDGSGDGSDDMDDGGGGDGGAAEAEGGD
ncbi:unnamed protein product [Vitrella brassicaformis CCMP3155]|uniref:Uncharacterized protein n=1 Tax=Vitrella brassicaformis (strain CCMP3155) TaxID=1169540 RepID=A0A0G4G6K0_VITBC|nr:unnamed protein product [Vitrella brassicaformis CCMP3155]|eukprot:CEM23976.1 unnamed protein product [Vitrella brassicaformis CCMP3155]